MMLEGNDNKHGDFRIGKARMIEIAEHTAQRFLITPLSDQNLNYLVHIGQQEPAPVILTCFGPNLTCKHLLTASTAGEPPALPTHVQLSGGCTQAGTHYADEAGSRLPLDLVLTCGMVQPTKQLHNGCSSQKGEIHRCTLHSQQSTRLLAVMLNAGCGSGSKP
eukprot:645559-Amphidinium_carterae.1